LHLCSNRIGNDGATAVGQGLEAQQLKYNDMVHHQEDLFLGVLILFDNRIGDPGCIALAQALEINEQLKQLDLRYMGETEISDVGAQAIQAALCLNLVLVLFFNYLSLFLCLFLSFSLFLSLFVSVSLCLCLSVSRSRSRSRSLPSRFFSIPITRDAEVARWQFHREIMGFLENNFVSNMFLTPLEPPMHSDAKWRCMSFFRSFLERTLHRASPSTKD
jgi:hypothetical protein